MAVKGLAGQQLNRNAPARRSGIVAAMQQTPAAAEVEQIALDDIASNPENPTARENDEDLAGLAESIREIGIVQALTLVPASDWVAKHPQHAEAVGEKRYVTLAGHRRRAAARIAGQDRVPAMIRPDLADTGASDVQLHENIHRMALTPLQEARAYATKVDEGFTQRQIAAAVKVSQGQVAKRLALLQLPDTVATAVDQGWYTVNDALNLLACDSEVIDEVATRVSTLTDAANLLARGAVEAEEDLTPAEAYADRAAAARASHDLRLSSLIRSSEQAVKVRHREELARQDAEIRGAKYLEDPRDKFKGKEWQHELTTKRDISREEKKGNLAVGPGYDDKPRYYALAIDSAKPSLSDAEAKRREDEKRKKKGRTESRKARIRSLAELASRKPSAAELRDQLVLHLVQNHTADADVKTLAHNLATEAGVGPTVPNYWDWTRAVGEETDSGQRERLAWILAWAAREQQHHTDTGYCPWAARDVQYLDDLIEKTSYEPGEWEQEQLAAARANIAHAETVTGSDDATDADTDTDTDGDDQ